MANKSEWQPGEYEHLVKVGAAGKFKTGEPRIDDMVDVSLRNDPTYFHVVLSHEEYLVLARRGEIEMDAETGYPFYTGTERLRG
jgi:hypothetical protein